jgi:hypothetical protein
MIKKNLLSKNKLFKKPNQSGHIYSHEPSAASLILGELISHLSSKTEDKDFQTIFYKHFNRNH